MAGAFVTSAAVRVLTMALLALALAVGFLTRAPSPAQAATKTYQVVVNDHGLRGVDQDGQPRASR